MTTNGGYDDGSGHEDNGDGDNSQAPGDNHTHNGTFSTTSLTGDLSDSISYQAVSANSKPPYYDVIFIKSDGYNFVPDGVIVFSGLETLPAGFSRCDGANGTPNLKEKYLHGAGTGEDSGATGGTLRHTHNIGHTHTSVSHYHRASSPDSGGGKYLDPSSGTQADANHGHVFNTPSSTLSSNAYSATYTSPGDIEPLYKNLDLIENTSGSGKLPKNIIGLWLGESTDIPIGWDLCDGTKDTPNLTNFYAKMPTLASNIGDQDGANAHVHSASNSHTHTATGTHTHSTGTVISGTSGNGLTGGGDNHLAPAGHHHTIQSIGTATATWGNATISGNSTNSEPAYRVVAFIQYKFSVGGSALFAIL